MYNRSVYNLIYANDNRMNVTVIVMVPKGSNQLFYHQSLQIINVHCLKLNHKRNTQDKINLIMHNILLLWISDKAAAPLSFSVLCRMTLILLTDQINSQIRASAPHNPQAFGQSKTSTHNRYPTMRIVDGGAFDCNDLLFKYCASAEVPPRCRLLHDDLCELPSAEFSAPCNSQYFTFSLCWHESLSTLQ